MDKESLDEDKKLILHQFRKNVSDLLLPCHDDRYLLRWLRAREFNLVEAEKMIRQNFKERRRMGAVTILKDNIIPEGQSNCARDVAKCDVCPYQFHNLRSYLPTVMLGYSKMGHIVRFIDAGSFDGKGISRSVTKRDALKVFMSFMETDTAIMEQNYKKTGKDIGSIVYIADYSKLRLQQWCDKEYLRLLVKFTNFYQTLYPETLHTIFAINAPSFIVYMYSILVRPFITEKVWAKIKLYSSGDDSYKEELFQLVPKEIVPAYLGGDRYDPEGDPTCDGLVHRKPKIPSSLYMKDKMTLKLDDPKVHYETVRERSIFEIERQIDVSGMTLCWQFQTKDHNIKFGLFYRESRIGKIGRDALEELIPVEITDCNLEVEEGEYVCVKEGTYILHFDNNYSWLRSKNLYYKVEVQEPDAAAEE